jgi:hypothetical protein
MRSDKPSVVPRIGRMPMLSTGCNSCVDMSAHLRARYVSVGVGGGANRPEPVHLCAYGPCVAPSVVSSGSLEA